MARAVARDGLWLSAQPGSEEFPDAEQVLLARERLSQVETAMAAMPERMRAALHMARVERRPQKEIAEVLGITVSGCREAVEARLSATFRPG